MADAEKTEHPGPDPSRQASVGGQFEMMSGFLAEVTEIQKEDTEDRKELVLSTPHPPTSETGQECPSYHFHSSLQ